MFNTKLFGRNGAEVERLEEQLAAQEGDRALLARELGTSKAQEIVGRVRQLEKQLAEATKPKAPSAVVTPAPGDEGEVAQPSTPLELMEKVRTFNNRIQDLNSTVAGMEAQLLSLYEEKEGMERQIGAGDLEGILQIIQGYKATISQMEQQLMTMYAARETLEKEMGTSDAHHIVTLFRSVSSLVGQIQQEMTAIKISDSAPVAKPIAAFNPDLPRVSPALYDVAPPQSSPAAVRGEENAGGAMPLVTPPVPVVTAPVNPAVSVPVATTIVARAPVATAPVATAPVATAPVATAPVVPVPLKTPQTTATTATGGADAQRTVNPAVVAAAAAFATAAAVSAASVAALPATGKGQLSPDDPEYNPLSNPNDPMNDDSLINGTP